MTKIWLWRNFVDGRPEYWAFDNPYPCHESGDPMTLGEPCGYAIVKQSINGRPDVSDAEVLAAIARVERNQWPHKPPSSAPRPACRYWGWSCWLSSDWR